MVIDSENERERLAEAWWITLPFVIIPSAAIAAGALTLLTITIIFAPSLHDRLMIAWLGPHWTETADASMVEMERATNAIFTLAMMQALTISSSAAVTVAIIVSLVASRQIVQPIDHLLQVTRRIAAGHYAERAPLIGDRELIRLAGCPI
ncbi:hypothetical protein [Chloroflexus sp.]|uniref:hypothetical protein n=1 Tax=Chloroflexus sp. TaxID=1904827 RepID=UPI004049CC4B